VCEEIRRRSGPEQTRARAGTRAAYQRETFHWELELTTPRHGDRPFEIVHIDHTELDVELVDSDTSKNLGRPWATLCIDAFSRRLLAVICLFDPPSYRSCMLVLRELVRRHNRFPDTVVVDNGKEFDSVYFETLLARFHTTKKSRPAGAPRFGSVCERLFGTSNTEFVHTLVGNTQIVRGPRAATGKAMPARNAAWSLPELYRFLCRWAYEVYDVREHVALAASPRDAFSRGMARTGTRAVRVVPYDDAFRKLTLPSTPKGTARVVAGRGVQIRSIYYWSVTDEFRSPKVEGTDVPVRYDPFDAGIAYAYVGSRWVRCISEYYGALRGRSERELQMASLELRRRREGRGGARRDAARQLADFLGSAEAAELLQLQRVRDRDMRLALADPIQPEAPDGVDAVRAVTTVAPRAKRRRRTPRAHPDLGALTEYESY
jgi:transposase InsO family protein